MSAEALQSTQSSADTAFAEYIENASRYDGSRTSPQKVALIHEMKRAGRSVNAISEILGMDDRTVKAVLARGDSLITDALMLLKANALGFAGDLIQASQEAAKRGKTEGIAAVLDRLGVTEPPKAQGGSQVAVQINLHGGPEPVSLAKVEAQSEGHQIQASNPAGLISQLMTTGEVLTSEALTEPSVSRTDALEIASEDAR